MTDPTGAAGEGGGRPAGAQGLLRLLEQCEAAGIERHALLLRLSRLPRGMTRPHHLRLARATLDPLLRADRGQLYSLSQTAPGDLVVVWRGAAEAAVGAASRGIDQLFADAALPDPAGLLEVLLLPRDAAVLLTAIDAARPPPAILAEPASHGAALDTVSLATLEARLASADVSRFARRRDICGLEANGRFALRWESGSSRRRS